METSPDGSLQEMQIPRHCFQRGISGRSFYSIWPEYLLTLASGRWYKSLVLERGWSPCSGRITGLSLHSRLSPLADIQIHGDCRCFWRSSNLRAYSHHRNLASKSTISCSTQHQRDDYQAVLRQTPNWYTPHSLEQCSRVLHHRRKIWSHWSPHSSLKISREAIGKACRIWDIYMPSWEGLEFGRNRLKSPQEVCHQKYHSTYESITRRDRISTHGWAYIRNCMPYFRRDAGSYRKASKGEVSTTLWSDLRQLRFNQELHTHLFRCSNLAPRSSIQSIQLTPSKGIQICLESWKLKGTWVGYIPPSIHSWQHLLHSLGFPPWCSFPVIIEQYSQAEIPSFTIKSIRISITGANANVDMNVYYVRLFSEKHIGKSRHRGTQ